MTRRARICIPFVGDSVGGSHMSMLLAIEGLDRDRFDPMLVLHEDGPLAAHLRERGVPYKLLPLPAYAGAVPSIPRIAGAALRAMPRLRDFLRAEGIDLVHANDLRMNFTWPLACRLTGVPHLWHQRTLLSSSRLWRAIPFAAAHVVCISRTVANTLPSLGRVGFEVLYNPFRVSADAPDRAAAAAKLRRDWGIPAEARVIAFVGRLVDQKRPETVLRAAAEIAASVAEPVHLVFIGRGEASRIDGLRRLAAELGIAGIVHFPGFVYPLESSLSGCDLLVAPAFGDGFGRTLVEAMMVGTPVVASDSGGHRDIVDNGRTGFLVPPDDVPAFAAAAIPLLTDTALRDEIAERARTHARKRFSIAAHVAGLSAIYDSLAKRPNGRPTT
ncbi:MAG: glycosyltransferase family 4 protein [Alphaproteobacteria bacterium]